MMLLFFVDRECLEDYEPLSDYTVPPALDVGGRLLADLWAERLGVEEYGLATRGFLGESVEWLTGGRLRPVAPRGDALLLNACASPFSGKLVSLLRGMAGLGSSAVYAGRRVVAVKVSSASRGLLDAFTGVVEPELVYGNMGMFEEEMLDPGEALLGPRELLAGLVAEASKEGGSYIGPGARVAPGAMVVDSIVEGDAVIEGVVKRSYVSRNSWVAGYVEDSIIGLGGEVYPGSYLRGVIAGVFARALPGLYAVDSTLWHGEEASGLRGAGAEPLAAYRASLYRRWGRLPSRFEEELLRRRRRSRQGRHP